MTRGAPYREVEAHSVLLMNGVFSIVELKDHNRVDMPPVTARGR